MKIYVLTLKHYLDNEIEFTIAHHDDYEEEGDVFVKRTKHSQSILFKKPTYDKTLYSESMEIPLDHEPTDEELKMLKFILREELYNVYVEEQDLFNASIETKKTALLNKGWD